MDMSFDLALAVQVLERTPSAIRALLRGPSDEWLTASEGPATWNPFDILGHLIHGERTHWIPRARLILPYGTRETFESFDRFAQFEASKGKRLDELLDIFTVLRTANLDTLSEMNLTAADLEHQGTHPEFGNVSLGQLLATWVVHDLGHLGQMADVMARQYKQAAGPWSAYLPLLRS